MQTNSKNLVLFIYFIAISSRFPNNFGTKAEEDSRQRYVIAALLPVHKGGYNFQCYGEIEDSQYMHIPQTLEALYFAIDMINK